MNENTHQERPSLLAPLFTVEESNELRELMLGFDGGMLDFGELDGFLSALAVAPQSSTLERWWSALLGPEPEWESEHEPERARALIERYYAMVKARVAMDPQELGSECVPPLGEWAYADEGDADWPEDLPEFADDDLYAEDDDVEDLASPAHHERVVPAVYVGARGDFAGDEDDDAAALTDDDWATPDADEEDDAHIEPDTEFEFGFAETWLSGFRYALSLQADDWRRALDEEPPLASWLYLLWVSADQDQGEGPLDALQAMAPTAAPPEDAGFLALEAALRDSARAQPEVTEIDDDGLSLLIPELLHQLWRRHHAQAGPVAAEIAVRYREGLLQLRDMDEDELNEMLLRHALPEMQLEYLDGLWSALAAAGEEVNPLQQLDRIFGAGKVWEDAREARELIHRLLRHAEYLRERLARKVDVEDPMCAPFIDFPPGEEPEKHPERPYGARFALGFLAGIEQLPRSARLLLMDPEAKHWLAPFEALAKGQSLEYKGKRLRLRERMGLISELPVCIAELSHFWMGEGMHPPEPVPARSGPLPGRNDPCPCGSGKKYKKCHGAPERLN